MFVERLDPLSHVQNRFGSYDEDRAEKSGAFGVAMDLWVHGALYHPTRRDWPSIPDPDDSWMLDLAFEATADYIVSWDPHLI